MRLPAPRSTTSLALLTAAAVSLAGCGGHTPAAVTATPPIIQGSASATYSVGTNHGTTAVDPRICAAYASVGTIEAHRNQIATQSASQIGIANSSLTSTLGVVLQAHLTPQITAAARVLAANPIRSGFGASSNAVTHALATLQAGLAPRCPGF